MRIEYPHRHERFGAVRIHDLTQVIELDSGLEGQPEELMVQGRLVNHVPPAGLNEVERRMAIVVPTKNERRKVIEGVLSGIPHDCLIVMVSASDREPIDRYELERHLLERFCHAAERPAVLVHQDDPGLGAALAAGGMEELVDDNGITRRGKGEAMIVGMLLADLARKDHVGFVDADNYVPGAVHEYVKAFAAGLRLAPTPYAMVRISWQSKPKIEGTRLVFNKWGRTSQVTNRFLNLVLSTYTGFGTDIVATGNAGEHAMTMELARRLRFAGGFAVEPFELVDLFEQFGGAAPSPHPEVAKSIVDVFQVETRNPHFHEDKGSDHVDDMRLQALYILHRAPICPPEVRTEIESFLAEVGAPTSEGRMEPVYRPFEEADLDAFARVLTEESETFDQIAHRRVTGVDVDTPIVTR
jgi:mannosyl-3-phosphoglycerate synthase